MLTFDAATEERSVLLSWTTTSETNSSHFAIERSADGKQWQELGTVPAQVESDSSWSYLFTDNYPLTGENLYRLRMVDMDSTFAFSRIRSVFFDTNGEIVLFPNPLTLGSELRIQTSDPSNIRQVEIIDTAGKQVLVSPWKSTIPVAHIAAGLYLVKIIYADGSVSHHRIVKQ
ncbi:T9SS type A sorting domain-containing protein [Dyadobacter sp. CY343]|uniref:T9SS type A sorting domain-containing protein n=1 Tax=Dyadobacter sp. CY343 TaxID=2907299 RepID=UPI001F30BF4F|nr:T9SS type A sorting domain-containing protein [Dyadobacter sp. CY343]MCE7060692.1 T9SS type A sorting domain-containing protein [Dyadobacter sp. CY343]